MRRRHVANARQHDATDCGAACLHSVARHYGVDVPIARIRQYAGTDRGGTSLRGLVEAAERLGFAARGVRAPGEVLESVPTPAIAHVKTAAGWLHYVVLYSATAKRARVMDPADGLARWIARDEFLKSWSGVLLLLAPQEGLTAAPSQRSSSLARFLALARPHRATMLQAGVGALAYTLLTLTTAVFVQKVVDYVIPDGNRDLLDLLTLAMVSLLAFQIYLRCVKDLLVLRTGQRIDAKLILGYYRHLLRLPQRFFDTMRVGEVVSRLNDAVKIRVFINEVALDLLVNALIVISSLGLMLTYSRELTTLVSASVPLYLLIYWAANRANRVDQKGAMEAAADLEAHVVEAVGAAATIRGLQLEEHSAFGAETRLVRLLRPVYGVGRTATLSGGMAEMVSRAATIALLWFGAVLVLEQSLTPGELMSFYALNGHLMAPILALIASNRQVQDALIAADRLFEIMDLERECDSGTAELVHRRFDRVQLRGVHFRYGSRPPLFSGLDVSLRQRELTAIIGESGSGKSTVAALVQRLHDPQQGSVLYGDLDVRHIRRESLRAAVAVVPQEAVLFTGSLLDNLAPGEDDPDLERLVGILTSVGLRELIDTLPAGLETQLGERGVATSGGQRQRIAIARALYRRPRVLVLDEATSGLDTGTEALVYRTLRRLQVEGVMVVVITHRLTTAMTADRILVLAKGKFLEDGTHAELMARRGEYYRLWQHQTGAVAPGRSARDGLTSEKTLPAPLTGEPA
jgi:ATP-binding cassette, subfamily C, bacteriocin exporter